MELLDIWKVDVIFLWSLCLRQTVSLPRLVRSKESNWSGPMRECSGNRGLADLPQFLAPAARFHRLVWRCMLLHGIII